MNMEQAKPLLELICRAENKEGRLVKGFMLPPEKESHMKLALGTTDGTLMFHAPLRNGKDIPAFGLLTKAVDLAAKGEREEALAVVDEFAQTSQVLSRRLGVKPKVSMYKISLERAMAQKIIFSTSMTTDAKRTVHIPFP